VYQIQQVESRFPLGVVIAADWIILITEFWKRPSVD
jgi:hypothetical protein